MFFGWFNDVHQHSGIALFAPADVYYGRVEAIAARRQLALDRAYAEHPERFPNGSPVARRPPTVVSINPLPVIGRRHRWPNPSDPRRPTLRLPLSGPASNSQPLVTAAVTGEPADRLAGHAGPARFLLGCASFGTSRRSLGDGGL